MRDLVCSATGPGGGGREGDGKTNTQTEQKGGLAAAQHIKLTGVGGRGVLTGVEMRVGKRDADGHRGLRSWE